MTTLREAAQQALEALNRSDYLGWQFNIPIIKALKAALAEPVQEAVALNDGRLWQYPDGSIGIGSAPPQRKPLTEEEIKKLLIEHAGMTVAFSEVDLRFARAIERAHGITP